MCVEFCVPHGSSFQNAICRLLLIICTDYVRQKVWRFSKLFYEIKSIRMILAITCLFSGQYSASFVSINYWRTWKRDSRLLKSDTARIICVENIPISIRSSTNKVLEHRCVCQRSERRSSAPRARSLRSMEESCPTAKWNSCHDTLEHVSELEFLSSSLSKRCWFVYNLPCLSINCLTPLTPR